MRTPSRATLLLLLPLLCGFLVTDEPPPHHVPDHAPLVWSDWIERIEDPHLRIVFLQRYNRLSSRCDQDPQIARDLYDLTIHLHKHLMDLAGRSLGLAETGRTLLQTIEPDHPWANRLEQAVTELETRQRLEERDRKITAIAIGQADPWREHSPEWCRYDESWLVWLQERSHLLSLAVRGVINELPEAQATLYLEVVLHP